MKRMLNIVMALLMLLCVHSVFGANYWPGELIAWNELKAGDRVMLNNAVKTTASAGFLTCRTSKVPNRFTQVYSLGMVTGVDKYNVFEVVEAPAQHEGVKSFYLRSVVMNKYVKCSSPNTLQMSEMTANISEATSFEPASPETVSNTFVNAKEGAGLLVHYDGATRLYFGPFHDYGYTYYGSATDIICWNFYRAMTKGRQIGLDELEDGQEVLFNNATNYLEEGPTQYLSPIQCTVKEPNYNQGYPLGVTDGYDSTKVWRLKKLNDTQWTVRSVSTGEYLTATAADGLVTTGVEGDALTFEFESAEENYTVFDWWVTNEKSVVMYHMDGETKMKAGPFRGYGYAYYNTGINNLPWNVYLVENTPSDDDDYSEDDGGAGDWQDAEALQGEEFTFGTVKSWDLGDTFVIKKVKFIPREKIPMTLGIFEGANLPDFADALPIYIVKDKPAAGKQQEVDITCTRGFRYVRYVGPAGYRAEVVPVKFYGERGLGDDSQLYQLTNVPTVVIHTAKAKEITSKTEYTPGIASVISDNGRAIMTDSLDVRGRGNGSWSLEKKPMKMKFRSKHRLPFLPAKAKKWALVSNHQDKSLMRNLVAFEVSRRLNMPYTPSATPVDVIVNGEYKGNFQLTDQVEVKKDRVPVTEMTPNDNIEPNVSGGYLIEVDAYAGGEPVRFYSNKYNTPVTVHYPKEDEITSYQKEYLTNIYNIMEANVFYESPKDPQLGIPSRIDVPSFLKRFLQSELSANIDAYWSVYMYKERGDNRFYFAPGWDFDHAFDNDSRCYPANSISGFLCLSNKVSIVSGMHDIISKVIENYRDDLRHYWSESRNYYGLTSENLLAMVDSLADYMEESQQLNFMRYPVLDKLLVLNTGIRYTYQAEVDFLKQTIADRIDWLDENVGLDEKKEYVLGDVNNDGAINVGDLSASVSFITDKANDEFIRRAADLDGDGVITANDVTALLIDHVLPQQQPNGDGTGSLVSSMTLSMSANTVPAGEETTVDVGYKSISTFNCFQFDITLPEGVTLIDVEKGSRLSNNHEVTVHKLADGTFRVVVNTLNGASISGVSGTFVKLKLKSAATMAKGQYDLVTENVFGARTNSLVVKFEDSRTTLNVGYPLGLHGVTTDTTREGPGYDVSGRQVLTDYKGIIVNKGKKHLSK